MDELKRLKVAEEVLEDVLDVLTSWDISEYVKSETDKKVNTNQTESA